MSAVERDAASDEAIADELAAIGASGPTSASTPVTGVGAHVRRLLKEPFVVMGLILLVPLGLFCAIVPLTLDESVVDPTQRFQEPRFISHDSSAPFFGTDHLGRNMTWLLAEGIRTSLLIGVSAVLLAAAFGWLVGAGSGYCGGRVDDLIGRLMDIFSAFPGLVMIIALSAVFGQSMLNLIVILAFGSWVVFGRVARAQTLALRESGYVAAARLAGASGARIIRTHVSRGTLPSIVAVAMMELPATILGEAAVSFLGFGLTPPDVSLGLIISGERDYLQITPWAVTLPGLALACTCVGFSLLGVGVRRTMGMKRRAAGAL